MAALGLLSGCQAVLDPLQRVYLDMTRMGQQGRLYQHLPVNRCICLPTSVIHKKYLVVTAPNFSAQGRPVAQILRLDLAHLALNHLPIAPYDHRKGQTTGQVTQRTAQRNAFQARNGNWKTKR